LIGDDSAKALAENLKKNPIHLTGTKAIGEAHIFNNVIGNPI